MESALWTPAQQVFRGLCQGPPPAAAGQVPPGDPPSLRRGTGGQVPAPRPPTYDALRCPNLRQWQHASSVRRSRLQNASSVGGPGGRSRRHARNACLGRGVWSLSPRRRGGVPTPPGGSRCNCPEMVGALDDPILSRKNGYPRNGRISSSRKERIYPQKSSSSATPKCAALRRERSMNRWILAW